jgi:hypothetical protein
MSREVVISLYTHNRLISLVMLDCQRQPLMRTALRRREIWEWSDHTRKKVGLDHGVGHFRPLSITRHRHLLTYPGTAMSHEGLCQVF